MDLQGGDGLCSLMCKKQERFKVEVSCPPHRALGLAGVPARLRRTLFTSFLYVAYMCVGC
jgi:hypothetical protein